MHFFYFKKTVRFLIIASFFFVITPAYGISFVYTPLLNEAQNHLVALRLNKARFYIAAEQKNNPDNIACDYLMAYVEFYHIMIHQQKNKHEAYEIIKNKVVDKIKLLPETNPARLYLLGSVHLQGAFVKGVFNEYLSAAFEFRTSYQYLEKNKIRFPSYLSNQKDLGALQALLGTFPENVKWIISTLGLNGSFEEGTNQLLNYIQHSGKEPIIEQQQAAIFYALIQLNFGSDKQVAWTFYQKYSTDYTGNLMQNYVRAYVAGKCGHNDEAIAILQAKPNTNDYEWIPYLDFLMGSFLLNRLDLEGAVWLKKYAAFNQTRGSLKDTYQRLSWCSLLQKDTARYRIYHNLMIKSAKNASSEEKLVDIDLNKGIFPNLGLIKARLYFDGGYYKNSEAQMLLINEPRLPSDFQKVEYFYRLARNAHEQKNYSKAINNYDKAILYAKGMQTYMAPNSCLQLGLIYQTLNYTPNARTYFNNVFEYSNYDYQSSIEQKAKAGIIQLKK